MLINSLISAKISASSATASTIPTFSLWKSALDVSHLEISFPSNALGAFTNNFAFLLSMKVKSVKVGTKASPPPQLPKIAVICGITPDANVCFM